MQNQLDRVLDLIKEEVFSSIDLFFAKDLLKEQPLEVQESALFLLCYLLASARQGHLCIHMTFEKLVPSPSFLTDDPEIYKEIEKKVIDGASNLPSSLLKVVEDDELDGLLKPICRYKNLLYLQKNWILETHFLIHLRKMAKWSLRLPLNQVLEINPKLNTLQNKAVSLALTSPISFISGGPGTGKTFTASEIVKVFLNSLTEEQKKTALIKIAAPTGKAAAHLEKKIASHLTDFTQVECGTLHSLLHIKSKRSFAEKGRALFADLILVDEASMLDAKLFLKLLSSLQEGGRLVFMGDKNQLPPVESGALFADLIECAEKISLPSISLTECLRVEKKELIDFAISIIEGNYQKVLSSSFVRCFSASSIHQIRELVWGKCQIYFSAAHDDTNQFRVLSCIRKGPLGVESLNEMVLNRFLEGRQDDEFFSVPILIRENSEPMGLMNGDVGHLVAKVSSLKKKRFDSEDKAHFATRSFSALLLPVFEWGYCLSVHKSQGSEYDFVIALAPKGSESFGKEVLYTAVTRAKKEMLLLGEEQSLLSLLSKSSLKVSGISQRLGVSEGEKGSTKKGSCSPCVLGSA
jgi:exodeoxyribonuclease V alpha subunit